jgi:hypothetical protein
MSKDPDGALLASLRIGAISSSPARNIIKNNVRRMTGGSALGRL